MALGFAQTILMFCHRWMRWLLNDIYSDEVSLCDVLSLILAVLTDSTCR
ncbi:conserved protein of unknown function [Pseudomonas marincola]|uniref:Uncharacterized protein n=1 Tax=Pseudomonas marincola TaxID=437900 RepID=A0A653EBE6_9PSED|nr:conserved protein of unknown function [Pseudomonas marincola]